MNGALAILLIIFLMMASAGVIIGINSWFGAYLNATSWLIILGVIGIFGVYVLIKADHQSNSR